MVVCVVKPNITSNAIYLNERVQTRSKEEEEEEEGARNESDSISTCFISAKGDGCKCKKCVKCKAWKERRDDETGGDLGSSEAVAIE